MGKCSLSDNPLPPDQTLYSWMRRQQGQGRSIESIPDGRISQNLKSSSCHLKQAPAVSLSRCLICFLTDRIRPVSLTKTVCMSNHISGVPMFLSVYHS